MNVVRKNKAFKRAIVNSIIMIVAYSMTWRFYAIWGILIAFLDLMAFLFCTIGFIRSIAFWIRNRKSSGYPFVPFFLNIATILVLIVAPPINRNKSYHKSTYEVIDCKPQNRQPLYVETYLYYGGGALGSDLNSVYLTDSLNYRQYIDTYDEGEEGIYTRCNGDSIIVEKWEESNSPLLWQKPFEKKIYSLSYLKKHHHYD